MDILARVIVFCLVVFLSPSVFAFGSISASQQTRFCPYYGGESDCRSTAEAVADEHSRSVARNWCSGRGAECRAVAGGSSCLYDGSLYRCDIYAMVSGLATPSENGWKKTGSGVLVVTRTSLMCPKDAQQVGQNAGVCECQLGSKPVVTNGVAECKPYSCQANSSSPITQPDIELKTVSSTVCSGGCVATPSSIKTGVDGRIWATWPYKYSGKQCGGNPDSRGVTTGESKIGDAPTPCGAGQCPGYVNGASVCVACSGETAQKPPPTTSPPTTSTPAPTVPSGGSSTSETTCDGSSCTTTTTVTDSTGKVVGSGSETKDQKSFCQENPASPMCKEGRFGGQCEQTTCEGDPIQCAIAQDQLKRACEWAKVKESLVTRGEASQDAGLTPAQDHPGAPENVAQVAVSNLVRSDDLLGSGCPADEVVSIGNLPSVTIPFSQLCGPLGLAGKLLEGAAWLAAMFIMFGKRGA